MAKVVPVHTIIGSYDEPITIRVYDETGATYRFYLDSYEPGTSTPFRTENVSAGSSELSFTITGLASNPDNQIHKLIITRDDGSGEFPLASINVAYIQSKYVVDIVDSKTGSKFPGTLYLIDLKNGVIKQSSTEESIGLPDPQYLSDKVFVEIVYNGEDCKYYYLTSYSKLASDFGNNTNVQIGLNKIPADGKIPVTIEYNMGIFSWLIDYALKTMWLPKSIIDVANMLGAKLPNYKYLMTLFMHNVLNIDIPIIDIEVDDANGIVKVTYEQDIAPILVYLIIAVVVTVGAVMIAQYIRDMYVAQQATIRAEVFKSITNDYINAKKELIKECITQYGDDQSSLNKCINDVSDAVDRTYQDTLTVFTRTYEDKYNTANNTIKDLETMLYVGGGIALLITILSLAKR